MYKVNRKYHFIYKTTNLINGRYYYGMHSTDNLEDGYLGSGHRLWKSIRKYGKENFKREIVEFCNSREELIEKEKEIVNLNEIAKKECMNIMLGGSGGNNNTLNDDVRQKAKLKLIILRKNNDWVEFNRIAISIGLKLSYESGNKKIIIPSFKGKKHTEESKIKMKLSNKKNKHQQGEKNSQYGTMWINKDCIIKKIKKEELENYKDWNLGRK